MKLDQNERRRLIGEAFIDGVARDSYWHSKKNPPAQDIIDYWVGQVFDHFIITHGGDINDAEARAQYSFNPRNRADEKYFPGYVSGMKALCRIERMEQGIRNPTPTQVAADNQRLKREDTQLGYTSDFDRQLAELRKLDEQNTRAEAADRTGQELDELARKLKLFD